MKNIFKKTYKSVLALGITIFFVLSMFMPMFGVRAGNVGSGSNCITGSVRVHPDFSGNFTITSATIDGSNINNNTSYCIDGNKHRFEIVVNTLSDQEPEVQWGGNWNDKTEVISNTNDQSGNYTFIIDFTTQNNDSVNLDVVNHQQHGSGEQPFDGRAVVVWSCGNGVCYHEFNDIPNFDDGNSTFYKASDITADNNTSIKFDVHAKNKDWILTDDFNRWVEAYKNKYSVSTINWNQVKPEQIIGNPIDMREWEDKAVKAGDCSRDVPEDVFHSCVDAYASKNGEINDLPFVKLQPLGEPTYDNAYVSYGDRNFKVVIYNEEYKGVSIGDITDLNYYPAEWNNAYTKKDQFDISNTTKDKPAVIDTVLLESTVNIKVLSPNGFSIDKMEALDVPSDAVSITKENGEYKLVFSSNFYDKVVFKVTDSNGKVSYLQIKRYTIDGWISHDDNNSYITADFYFDNHKSYSDFVLTANIVYKDGSKKLVNMKAHYGIDDGLGNITKAYEVNEETITDGPRGKGLKHSTFEYELEQGEEEKIDKIYINAEYKGSTDTNYAGAFAGSGNGVVIEMRRGE